MTRLAISIKEFAQMLQSSCPPSGWGSALAVAYSGGADSTCLLYLLHRLVSEKHDLKNIPRELIALTVDHSLQRGSAAVADQCRRFSDSLRIPHAILRIPWGQYLFPDLPAPGRPYESVARAARYRVLLEAMAASGTTVVAMGHHADDHVETILMRLARDGRAGAAGAAATMPASMRNCRRWGMGSKSGGLDRAGMAGMRRWIVRPLLAASKERILATCELHGLKYTDDPTNFQPSLTPRNYVRYVLSNNRRGNVYQDIPDKSGNEVRNLDRAVQRLSAIASNCNSPLEEMSQREWLYAAATYLGKLRSFHDEEVDRYLRDFTRASPPSTLFLSLSRGVLPAPDIRRAIILRVLRFVSPRPWGSPLSEASRRSHSLDLISDKIWSPSADKWKAFSAGSDVVWRPASLRKDGSIRLTLDKEDPIQNNGWLASRQPPMKKTGIPSPCVQDISDLIASRSSREILWDNRFLLKLRPQLLPSDILDSCNGSGSVVVLPHGPWFLPKVVWRKHKDQDVLLGDIGLRHEDNSVVKTQGSKWIDIEWIRPLDAI